MRSAPAAACQSPGRVALFYPRGAARAAGARAAAGPRAVRLRRGLGLPRRLLVRRPRSASAALGPPQNVMLEAGARDRAKILRPRGVREGSALVHPRLALAGFSLVRLRASSSQSLVEPAASYSVLIDPALLRAVQSLPHSSPAAVPLETTAVNTHRDPSSSSAASPRRRSLARRSTGTATAQQCLL